MRDTLAKIVDPIVLDIGANIGHHSLYASTIAKEVHSFEPFPKVIAKIHEKIKANAITNIKVHEIALGEADEDSLFTPPSEHNTGSGSFIATSVDNSFKITLPIRRGDEYVKTLKLSKIDFIKMDIEGFEPQALRGLRHTLDTYRPVVFFEWSANEREFSIELDLLFPEKYKIFNLIANRPFLGIFCHKDYTLIEENASHRDGNKLAVPIEKLSTISAINNKLFDKFNEIR